MQKKLLTQNSYGKKMKIYGSNALADSLSFPPVNKDSLYFTNNQAIIHLMCLHCS